MANENAAASKFSLALPLWPVSVNGVPKVPYGAVSKEVLEFTASRLHEQADYLKKLAECEDLAQAMKCQLEFAQSWSRSFGEAWKALDHLRTQS